MNASRTSSACAYSNRAAITEPGREICLAPGAVFGGGVERTKRGVVEHRLVRVDEGVPEASPERPARSRLELFLPRLELGRFGHLLVHGKRIAPMAEVRDR